MSTIIAFEREHWQFPLKWNDSWWYIRPSKSKTELEGGRLPNDLISVPTSPLVGIRWNGWKSIEDSSAGLKTRSSQWILLIQKTIKELKWGQDHPTLAIKVSEIASLEWWMSVHAPETSPFALLLDNYVQEKQKQKQTNRSVQSLHLQTWRLTYHRPL